MKKDRRQFLKNTVLATTALSISPLMGNASILKENSSANMQSCNQLTQDYYGEGPFYTANAPVSNDGIIVPNTEPGTRLRITGVVKNLDCTEIIPNTVIDLWHANDAGDYDNSGYHLRRKVSSNSAGFYSIETIQPGKYLNGSSYRPSHIHFKITTPGFPTLTTQIYFEGDTDIPGDAAASITSGTYDATHRIIPLTSNNGVMEGTWDIAIDGNGVLGVSDLHLTNGMIYGVSPNPFTEELHINYGLFKPSKVKIEIYNLAGQLVANIEEKQLEAEKYTAVWRPQIAMPSGMYFCVLKVNDLQVHYQKIIKK